MTAEQAAAVARAFVAARAAGTALPAYPGAMPERLADGYAVQEAALRLDGRAVAGWKVGRVDPPRDGADRFAGPILDDRVSDAAAPAMPVIAGGFAAAEAEFVMRVGTAPDPARRGWTPADAAALIDAVHAGIEIAASPFPGIGAHGPAVTVSDFGNNGGLVLGPALPTGTDLLACPVELRVNDTAVGRATGAAIPGGPFAAFAFLLDHLAARGRSLAAGQWISTGAVTGVHHVAIGDRVEARFGDAVAVRCSIAAAA